MKTKLEPMRRPLEMAKMMPTTWGRGKTCFGRRTEETDLEVAAADA